MANLSKNERAYQMYCNLCAALNHEDWKYTKDNSDLSVRCTATGDDLPIDLYVKVDAQRQLVQLYSALPFTVKEDKRLDFAIAVTAINNGLVNGCFDFNIQNGNLMFRMVNSFKGSSLSEDVFAYMIYCSCATVDEYNDKLLMLAKDMLSITDFLE